MTDATQTLARFNQLKNAEEYFEFFGLAYDPKVVNINRLHILGKFSQLVQAVDEGEAQTDEQKLGAYRQALQDAYEVFLESSGVEQKIFKVFNDQPKNVVMVSDITAE